jgi:hypothetical protein
MPTFSRRAWTVPPITQLSSTMRTRNPRRLDLASWQSTFDILGPSTCSRTTASLWRALRRHRDYASQVTSIFRRCNFRVTFRLRCPPPPRMGPLHRRRPSSGLISAKFRSGIPGRTRGAQNFEALQRAAQRLDRAGISSLVVQTGSWGHSALGCKPHAPATGLASSPVVH